MSTITVTGWSSHFSEAERGEVHAHHPDKFWVPLCCDSSRAAWLASTDHARVTCHSCLEWVHA